MLSPLFVAFLLISSIAAIILLSARFKFNTFFVLLIIAAVVGFAAGFDGEKVIVMLKTGFGSTLEKIGLLIICGTTLGILLEKSNATLSLAQFILSKTGDSKAALALTLIGFMVGLPIFCDSGFVVLIGLGMSIVSRLPKWHVALVVCLASALYSVHCLVPPHPGITAAAGIMKVDVGRAMFLGTLVAVPPTVVAYFWAKYINQKLGLTFSESIDSQLLSVQKLPHPLTSVLPIFVPILLIALKSLVMLNPSFLPPSVLYTLKILGEPLVALFVGILFALPLYKNADRAHINSLFDTALDKSGGILAITAAGGAFGEVIKALELGKVFGDSLAASGLGLVIPFALAAIFKTAQGSSTVAIISTAGIIAPLLPSLGFDTEGGHLFALLAAGAGSMLVSHTNDSYFWVIAKFSSLDTVTTLRSHSVASVLMAVAAFVSIWVASLFV
ncbi:MAG: GntP family permease [Saprospiraceae bacterium]|nr:GntP family permease [Saprospiraceae bacterium]